MSERERGYMYVCVYVYCFCLKVNVGMVVVHYYHYVFPFSLSLSLYPGLPSFSLSFSFTSLFPPPPSLSPPLILYPTLPLFNSSTALQLPVAMMEAMAPAPSLTQLTHGHNAPTLNAGPATIMMSVTRGATMLVVSMMEETARFYYPLVLQSKCVIDTVLSDVTVCINILYVCHFFSL